MPHTDVDYRRSHNRMVRSLLSAHVRETAMSLAVGGNYEVVGAIESELLKHYGLKPDAFLVDVGCGSGRLAAALASYLQGRYLGLDVVPELLEYAAEKASRPDWQFLPAPGLSIPLENGIADMVSFFSVFTHLFHQESYAYLLDAFRVLKPGGRAVFSFLEFTDPAVWPTFGHLVHRVVNGSSTDSEHVQFLSRDAISVWAGHLGFQIVQLVDGCSEMVTLPRPVQRDDGQVLQGKTALGQAVCVFAKPDQ